MANRRSASPGKLDRELRARGQVSAAAPGAQLDNGTAARAAASVFAGIGSQLGQMADRAAVRVGVEEGTAAGAAAADGAPLELRRDGTIRGDAYDAAAERAYGWRLTADIDSTLTQAFDANQDNPDALAAAIAAGRDQYAKDPNLADPQVREAFERQYDTRSKTYLDAAKRGARAKARAEATAAAGEQYEAATTDLERRSYLLGSSPDGDAELERELGRNRNIIDQQVGSGAITAAEGRRRKEGLEKSAAKARVRGVFETLPDLASKEKFARDLLDGWADGKGPLAHLDYNTVYGLQSQLIGQARAERAEETKANVEGRISLQRSLEDDIASMGATGAPGLIGGREIDPADVTGVLGERAALEWEQRRNQAKRVFDATADLASLPEAEIYTRVAGLEPKAGAEGFADSERVYEAASRKAKSILDLRRSDPAAAVEGTFATVQQAKAALDPERPETYRGLAQARMDAQAGIGIPELARAPLTKREAQAIAGEISRASDPGAAARTIAGQLAERYGDLTDGVLTQVLREAGSGKDAAAEATAILRRADGRRPVSAGGSRAADASRASSAVAGEDRPKSFKQVPTYQQITRLLDNPGLAAQFDEKFGAGWSAFYLRQRTKSQDRVGVDLSRPKIQNGDGSFSTERTITIGADEGGRERFFNIPTIVGGRQLTDDEAVAAWRAGHNPDVGSFGSVAEAEAAARARSEEIGRVRGDEGESWSPDE